MGVETADFDGLAAFWTKCDHSAVRVKMLIPKIIILEAFIENTAIITDILWIIGSNQFLGLLVSIFVFLAYIFKRFALINLHLNYLPSL